MKLRFNREELAEALTTISAVASVRTPKEILKCVRMEALSDALLLAATDQELSLRSAVTQIEVEEPGETLVVADTLARIVRECPDEILVAETEQNMLHVRGAGSHFKIVTQAPGDFPAVPDLQGEADFTIDGAVLRRLIEWTVFAVARESTRYAINGVLWELSEKSLTLAATDGRRLSVARGDAATPKTGSVPQVIVPGRALSLFSRLPADGDGTVMVKVTGNQLLLKLGRSTLGTSLIEGQFPKYEDVVPQDCDRHVELNVAEFHGALKQAALLTNEESKGVRVAFAEGSLTLSSRAPEQGEATISMPVDYSGEPVDMGFNPNFLTDVLRVAHEEKIRFDFKEANRPGVIRLSDDFVHVVMPVTLTSA